MQDQKNRSSIAHLVVFAGLWFINTLIVIFGLPFLAYKKMREICSDQSKKQTQAPKIKSESHQTAYLQRQMDSKL